MNVKHSKALAHNTKKIVEQLRKLNENLNDRPELSADE